MNRICPTEELLSKYLGGNISPESKKSVEKHLCGCAECRTLVAEAYDIVKKTDVSEVWTSIISWIRKNIWLIGATAALFMSFLIPGYFLQFLAVCLLMGAKWMIDSKTTKMLIMIHDVWKHGDRNKAEKILSQIDKE